MLSDISAVKMQEISMTANRCPSSSHFVSGEIVEGLEDMPETDNHRCYVFNRYLTNFNESQSHAVKYIDFQNGRVDADSQSRLGTVRDLMKTKIAASNYHRYSDFQC